MQVGNRPAAWTRCKATGQAGPFFSAYHLIPAAMPYPENNQPNPAQIKQALLLNNEQLFALDELIATGEAVFNIIRFSELDPGIKDAFYQLEKQFTFYANLLMGEGCTGL